MSTKGIGRANSKSKRRVIGSRKLSGIIKSKGHSLPASPSYLDMSKLKKGMSDDLLMMELFKEWMHDFDRTYPTKEEEEKRFWVFKDHARERLEYFEQDGKYWGMNGFADMSGPEFAATYLGGISHDSDSDPDIISKNATTHMA